MPVVWNYDGRCDVSSWTDIVAVSAGVEHTVGLKADGTVVAVGGGVDGRRDVSKWTGIMLPEGRDAASPSEAKEATQEKLDELAAARKSIARYSETTIGADYSEMFGLRTDGTVIDSRNEDLGWTDIIAISAGHNCTIGLKTNGTIVTYGNNAPDKSDTDKWKDLTAASAGYRFGIGLTSKGTAVAAGKNDEGQCRQLLHGRTES